LKTCVHLGFKNFIFAIINFALKKIDKLVLFDFLPPYFMAFFVVEFVLIMQFLWKYIDEIIGKGFSLGVLLEMLFYFSVRIIPEAVPVTILIASVMVFGTLSEKYEISSMKSAGISLTRIMWMGILIAILTALFSLLASNYLKPRANYKFYYRFNAIRKQKPALNLAEGVFSKDFRNFVIRVGSKDENGQDIKDVLVYDHSGQDRKLINMLTADEGRMYSGENNEFIMDLENGEQYKEMKPKKKGPKTKESDPFVRTKFEKWTKIFDMSEFEMEAQNLNITRKEFDLLNSFQLIDAIDSIDIKREENLFKMNHNFKKILTVKEYEKVDENAKNLPKTIKTAIDKKDKQVKSSTTTKPSKVKLKKQKLTKPISEYATILETFDSGAKKELIAAAKAMSGKQHEVMTSQIKQDKSFAYSRSRYVLRLHQQYSWALICVVFLFIGAPLGSIVKKGGYGYPLLIAIVFFMLFIILNIIGEKLNKGLTISPILAAWLPNLVIIPVAMLFTYRAVNDLGISDISGFFLKIGRKLRLVKTADV